MEKNYNRFANFASSLVTLEVYLLNWENLIWSYHYFSIYVKLIYDRLLINRTFEKTLRKFYNMVNLFLV